MRPVSIADASLPGEIISQVRLTKAVRVCVSQRVRPVFCGLSSEFWPDERLRSFSEQAPKSFSQVHLSNSCITGGRAREVWCARARIRFISASLCYIKCAAIAEFALLRPAYAPTLTSPLSHAFTPTTLTRTPSHTPAPAPASVLRLAPSPTDFASLCTHSRFYNFSTTSIRVQAAAALSASTTSKSAPPSGDSIPDECYLLFQRGIDAVGLSSTCMGDAALAAAQRHWRRLQVRDTGRRARAWAMVDRQCGRRAQLVRNLG
eukprot:2839001-Pleurochrysis_carterae.AAC.2